MTPRPCVFCRIVAGELPASVVHRGERCWAFMDLRPIRRGHVLVVPVRHAVRLHELDGATRERMWATGQRVAAAQRAGGLPCRGHNFLLNDGSAANQTVPHAHLHVIPRAGGDLAGTLFRLAKNLAGLGAASRAALDAEAEKIRRHLADPDWIRGIESTHIDSRPPSQQRPQEFSMKIEGEHTFDAPREMVWKTVQDPDVLAQVLPGCEDFHEVGDGEFEGQLKIKVGPVQGKFKGNVELTDLVEPESYKMRVRGKGAPGFVDGQGELRLEDAGDKTVLHYEVDAKVGGRIASVGQRLLDSSSKVITRQALEGLDQHIRAQNAAAAGAEAPAEVAPPSQAKFAAGFAKGMLDELVPPQRRPLVFGVAAVAAVVLGLLGLRACG